MFQTHHWGGQENHLEQPAPDNRRPSSVSLEFPLAVLPVPFGKCVWRGGYDADFIRFVSFVNGNIGGYTRAVLSVIMMAIQPP